MAVAFRAAASGTADNADVTVSVPPGTLDGDFMLAVVCNRSTTGALTTPTGWTLMHGPLTSNAVRVWVLRRIAASEPASYTFDIDTPDKGAAAIVSYSGAEFDTSTAGEDSDGSPQTGPSVTPSVNNCMIVHLGGAWGDGASSPDTDPVATERVDVSLATFGPRVYVQEFLQSTAAAIALEFTNDGQVWELVSVSLKPSAPPQTVSPSSLTRTRAIGSPNLQTQRLAPSTDSVDGSWTDQAGGTALAAAIDETLTASDADYIRSPLAPSNSGCRVKLQTGGDPVSSSSHKIKWRVGKDLTGGNTVNMTVKLYQGGGDVQGGGTLIAQFTRNSVDAFTTYEENLSAAEADAITNYGDLYLEFFANQV